MSITNLFYIDEFGITYPDYPTLLDQLKDQLRAIFGSDINLDADSQDGQSTAIIASAVYDTMQIAVAVYNSFSPQTALSDALTRNVKINGIARDTPSYSQVNLKISGTAGTIITSGVAEDVLGQKWLLPAIVTIPFSGEIIVTALAQNIGTVSAAAGTVTTIDTPTRGWQEVTNDLPASDGAPVESDYHLRIRQSLSTMIPNLTVLDGIIGGIASITNVQEVVGYQNDEPVPDSRGIPGNSISLVVEGGDAQAIGEVIARKKSPGVGTYGDIPIITTDPRGVQTTVYFFEPVPVVVDVQVYITVLPGYLSTTSDDIIAAVSEYLDSLKIGEKVYNSKLCVPANLSNSPQGNTFNVTSILSRVPPNPFTNADIPIAFNQKVDVGSITVIAT